MVRQRCLLTSVGRQSVGLEAQPLLLSPCSCACGAAGGVPGEGGHPARGAQDSRGQANKSFML